MKREIRGRLLKWDNRIWYKMAKSDKQSEVCCSRLILDGFEYHLFFNLFDGVEGIAHKCQIEITDKLACSRFELGPVMVLGEDKRKSFTYPNILYKLLGACEAGSIVQDGGKVEVLMGNTFCRLATWEELE